MITRHKNKAIVGVTVWFAAIPLALVFHSIGKKFFPPVDRHDPFLGALLLSYLAVQYLAFFWGGTHLAKAKGHSPGMLAFGIFWPAQIMVLFALLFALPDKHATASSRSKKHRPDESHTARIIRCRRNALVANGLGVAGVLLALALTYVRIGFFAHPDSAKIIAIFVFVAGYATIVYGCWWWLQAKKWDDAILLIGLSPLIPLLIRGFLFRGARELYIIGGFLPLMMAVMSAVMLGVVAVLPDKSGLPRRKRWDRD